MLAIAITYVDHVNHRWSIHRYLQVPDQFDLQLANLIHVTVPDEVGCYHLQLVGLTLVDPELVMLHLVLVMSHHPELADQVLDLVVVHM